MPREMRSLAGSWLCYDATVAEVLMQVLAEFREEAVPPMGFVPYDSGRAK
jgi:hypothetical protein